MKLRELHDKLEFETVIRLFLKEDSSFRSPIFKTGTIPEFMLEKNISSFWARGEDEIWVEMEEETK
ncbi:hypothetical protein RG007_004973 [Vibrio parahaemolyticus]|nr:hypothetical protein [Vibrio parahaemolyticus]